MIEVNITPQDIDNLVKESILKAGLGTSLQKVINESLAVNSYNSPIKKAVEEYVLKVCTELVRDKYADAVKLSVSKAIEAMVTKEIIDEVVDKSVKKMIDGSRGY